MSHYIELRREGMVKYVDGRTQGYRMVVTALNAQNMSDAIFVFERATTGTGEFDEFANIASPADLEEWAEGAPDAGDYFYRLTSVDLVFRNITLADEAWLGIVNDVQQLVQTLNFMDELQTLEDVSIGSSSSSSSSSA